MLPNETGAAVAEPPKPTAEASVKPEQAGRLREAVSGGDATYAEKLDKKLSADARKRLDPTSKLYDPNSTRAIEIARLILRPDSAVVKEGRVGEFVADANKALRGAGVSLADTSVKLDEGYKAFAEATLGPSAVLYTMDDKARKTAEQQDPAVTQAKNEQSMGQSALDALRTAKNTAIQAPREIGNVPKKVAEKIQQLTTVPEAKPITLSEPAPTTEAPVGRFTYMPDAKRNASGQPTTPTERPDFKMKTVEELSDVTRVVNRKPESAQEPAVQAATPAPTEASSVTPPTTGNAETQPAAAQQPTTTPEAQQAPQFSDNVQQMIDSFTGDNKFSLFNMGDSIVAQHPDQRREVIRAIDHIITRLPQEQRDIYENYKSELEGKLAKPASQLGAATATPTAVVEAPATPTPTPDAPTITSSPSLFDRLKARVWREKTSTPRPAESTEDLSQTVEDLENNPLEISDELPMQFAGVSEGARVNLQEVNDALQKPIKSAVQSESASPATPSEATKANFQKIAEALQRPTKNSATADASPTTAEGASPPAVTVDTISPQNAATLLSEADQRAAEANAHLFDSVLASSRSFVEQGDLIKAAANYAIALQENPGAAQQIAMDLQKAYEESSNDNIRNTLARAYMALGENDRATKLLKGTYDPLPPEGQRSQA